MKSRVLILLLTLSMIFAFSTANADSKSLENALEKLAQMPAQPPLNMPPVTEAWVRLMTENGHFAELGLDADEGRIYAEAVMQSMGITPREIIPFKSTKAAPTNPVVTPAEFEPMDGVIIYYPAEFGYSQVEITWKEMLIALDGDPDTTVYIIAESESQKATVESRIADLGLSGSNFEFYIYATDTVWSRDYGPVFIHEFPDGGDPFQSLVDMNYYGRPNDDKIPDHVADEMGIDSYDFNLSFEGGNYFSDGAGTCFSSTGLDDFNPGTNLTTIRQMLLDYMGCEQHIMVDPLIGEGTTHIDMFAKMLDPLTIIVGQYEDGEPNYQRLEDVAAQLATVQNLDGDYFDIVRIPMPPEYNKKSDALGYWTTYRSYTNSTILNNKVLVPIYNIPMDADGLAVYEDVYEGTDMEVIGIDSEAIIEWGGAVHCVTMEHTSFAMPASTDDDDDDDDTTDDDDVTDDDDAVDDDDTTTDDDDDTADDDDDVDSDDDDDDDSGCGC